MTIDLFLCGESKRLLAPAQHGWKDIVAGAGAIVWGIIEEMMGIESRNDSCDQDDQDEGTGRMVA